MKKRCLAIKILIAHLYLDIRFNSNLFFYRFGTDTEAELALVRELCLASGAFDAVVANHWAEGGAGATDLGKSVIAACAAAKSAGSPFSYVT